MFQGNFICFCFYTWGWKVCQIAGKFVQQVKSGSVSKYKKFLWYTFFRENIGNFFKYDIIYFTFEFGNCARPLHISLLIT